MPAEPHRLTQLLGVFSLAATDRFRSRVESTIGHAGEHAGALIHLNAYPGGSIEALRGVLRVSQPGALAVVRRLESDGLVLVEPGGDGRSKSLRLTSAGERAAEEILAARAAELEALLAPLSAGERATLEPLMSKLVSRLADDRPAALRVCRLCDRETCCGAPERCPLDHTVPAA